MANLYLTIDLNSIFGTGNNVKVDVFEYPGYFEGRIDTTFVPNSAATITANTVIGVLNNSPVPLSKVSGVVGWLSIYDSSNSTPSGTFGVIISDGNGNLTFDSPTLSPFGLTLLDTYKIRGFLKL